MINDGERWSLMTHDLQYLDLPEPLPECQGTGASTLQAFHFGPQHGHGFAANCLQMAELPGLIVAGKMDRKFCGTKMCCCLKGDI